jgi:hypothetical protein
MIFQKEILVPVVTGPVPEEYADPVVNLSVIILLFLLMQCSGISIMLLFPFYKSSSCLTMLMILQ